MGFLELPTVTQAIKKIGWLMPDGWTSAGGGTLYFDPNSAKGFQLRVDIGDKAGIRSLAVRLKLTGKKRYPRYSEGPEFRCRITVPGDGEPDTRFSGWVFFGRS